jgi:hypothetical protein
MKLSTKSNLRRNKRGVWPKLIQRLEKMNNSSADLRSANLSSADLRSANLSSADLSSADLSSADLSYADLSYANLSYADLRYANLSYANLSYADLSSADLSSADLSSADLSSADLSSAYPVATVSGVGSEKRLAIFWIENSELKIIAGCFNGTKEELLTRSEKYHGKDSAHYRGYAAAIAYAEIILAEHLKNEPVKIIERD